MTKEEAIEILERGEWWEYLAQSPDNDAAIDPLQDALEEAIDALRAQAKAEKNDPLTPDELREMDGEKIYVHYIDGFYTDEDGTYFGKFEQLVRDCEGKLTACSLPLGYYGKTWLAYRRKPEEGTA